MRLPSGLRAVVFDLDGVLIDSEQANLQSAQAALARAGRRLTPEDRRLIVGRHPLDYLPDLLERHGLGARDLPSLTRVQQQAYERAAAVPVPRDGASAAVRRIHRRGLALGLATSSERRCARAALEALGVLDLFSVIVALEDVARRKPDPEPYRLSARRLGVPARCAAAVEDSVHGVRAAREAGLYCIGLRGPWTRASDLADADAVVETLDDVDALLRDALASGRDE